MPQSFRSALPATAALYLKLLHTKVTATTIRKDLQESPFYPSLLSLSATFDKYKISNQAFEVSRDSFMQLQPPFIAYIKLRRSEFDFVLVKEVIDEKVAYLYKSKKPKVLSKEEFLKKYQGVVWFAEPDSQSGDLNYARHLKSERAGKYRNIALIVGILTIVLLFFINNVNLQNLVAFSIILAIKFLGLSTAVLLLIYEIDMNNTIIDNICNASAQFDCAAILNSKAAKFKQMSWSEIGYFYFATTSLWLLFPFVPFADKVGWIAISNAIAMPYTIFSLFYQWKVAKQWCPFCLTVQGVLLAEFFWGLHYFYLAQPPVEMGSQHASLLIACFLLPTVCWFALKPVLIKSKQAELYRFAYTRLQHNPEIFSGLLQLQPLIPDGWQQLGINLGNPSAENIIIKICNPYCSHCAEVHPVLEELIKQNQNVQLKIIFQTRYKVTEGLVQQKVVKHLVTLAQKSDPSKLQQALNEWYLSDEKEYDLFAAKYPLDSDIESQARMVNAMNEWCATADIKGTPTILVNGRRLPDNYNVEELKNVL